MYGTCRIEWTCGRHDNSNQRSSQQHEHVFGPVVAQDEDDITASQADIVKHGLCHFAHDRLDIKEAVLLIIVGINLEL